MTRARRPFLVVGIDAAEGRVVRQLAEQGLLPTIKRLAAESGWGTVTSPAPLGSGAVWPTFSTGQAPDVHGLFGEYAWDPETMTFRRPDFSHLVPFWKDLALARWKVAVIDIPFAPIVGHERLVEITGWGAHDWCGNLRVAGPRGTEGALADILETPHPLRAGPVDSDGPGDISGLRDVARACAEGVRRRGELARRVLDIVSPDVLLVVFPEVHRASHLLWHTLDTDHPAWRESLEHLPDDVMRGLLDVFAAVDGQIGRLLSHSGDTAEALVFSLHGMQQARGVPAFLSPVLEAWGVSARQPWWRRSPYRHASDFIRGVKQVVPKSFKAAYYRHTPKSVTRQLSQSAVPLPDWDWPRTRAFSMPSDQHGWVRINLAGRESQGLVTEANYQSVCGELRDRFLSLSSSEGSLVKDVLLTASAAGPPRHLPDLVVHWTPLTWRPHLRLLDPPLDARAIGLKFVGQHDDNGFFVRTQSGTGWPPRVDASEMGVRIRAMLDE